ncbi:MAG TPA: hypothetical protein VK766_09430, partial [Cytophagaceae bacterium]|nr:hypothetical protein [Cytophagaceae bacterium]
MNNAEQRSENTHTSGNLRLQADDTFEPLLSTMIETFESIYPKATIGLKYQAQEQAFQDLVKGNTDMLIAGRPLNQFEID